MLAEAHGPDRLASDMRAFRAELRAFLASSAVEEWRHGYREDVAEQMWFTAGLLRVLYDAGFGRYGVPGEAGGLGGDVRHWAVLHDELAAADLPTPGQHSLLVTLAYPVIAFAPHLAAAYLPECLRGDAWWGQGFSESEAGSDLAALRCRARRRGDRYAVSGHKLWTSYGATASRIVTLVRTGSTESRHRGLSMLLIDVAMPGVTVRPITLANGRAEVAECFFDDVQVPAERLIGEENGGWAVAMYLLQFERALYAWQRAATLSARLRALARLVPESALARQRLGSVCLDVACLRARSVQTVRRLAAGEPVGPEASADKLLLGLAEQSVSDTARALLGPGFALGGDAETARWREEWWFSRTTTLYGGSAEIQRNIIADRMLRLPTE
jgi:alkylation response protein AidB-like acyl-CoA dehydrogenase